MYILNTTEFQFYNMVLSEIVTLCIRFLDPVRLILSNLIEATLVLKACNTRGLRRYQRESLALFYEHGLSLPFPECSHS